VTADPKGHTFPLAVLISGSGSTLRNILQLCADGRLRAQVVGVVASRDCTGLDHARQFDVPFAVVKRGKPFDVRDFSARVTAMLDQWRPQLIAFGGFLSMYLPPPQYQGKVINIHPALLPGFGGKGMYGDRVHEAVLAAGVRVTGCTVHLVDEHYDAGPIVAQRAVPVLDGDTVETLGARVRATERELYPTVIGWFAEGRVTLGEDGRVRVANRRLRGTQPQSTTK
jgi:formyltetrahydrofolate-dependent phosphoribosylglycinamide formyltransferase